MDLTHKGLSRVKPIARFAVPRTGLALRFFVMCALVCLAAFPMLAASAAVSGIVSDENGVPVGDARVILRTAGPTPAASSEAETDAAGRFSFGERPSGEYIIEVAQPRFYVLKDQPVHVADKSVELTLTLHSLQEIFQSIDVKELPSPVDIAQTSREERLTGTEVNQIPYQNSHSFRRSLRLMPGVVEDRTGAVHFNGSAENQVEYVLNGFNIADPITGQFRSTLAVEGIRSAEFSSGRYSTQFGRGSAGVLQIQTQNGTDAFRYTATNFVPGVDFQQGIRLGNWYPRAGISGPIVRGRAWFSDVFDVGRSSMFITGLPEGEPNTRVTLAASNLLHTQVNLTPTNILFTDFLVNFDRGDRIGLGPLDPAATTITTRNQQFFVSVRDQFNFGNASVIELGYAHNYFLIRQRPQGSDLYVYSPEGRSGNYFVRSDQTATRDQATIHAYAPTLHYFGSHQIQAGGELHLLRYTGDFSRTGYEVIGLSGRPLSQTTFTGTGMFEVRDTPKGVWAVDTWRVSERLQVVAGIRQDWDTIVHNQAFSPRIAFSFSPFRAGHTRIAGGYSVTHDAVPLDPFGRLLDQAPVTTSYSYAQDGTATPTTVFSSFQPGSGLKIPRAENWTVGVDHKIAERTFLNVNYLRRRNSDGFSFVDFLSPNAPPSLLPFPNSTQSGAFQLTNGRRDVYDSVQFTVRQSLSGQYEWLASYTRSRAHTNAVTDVNTLFPTQLVSEFVPMAWDAPNRFIGWAYVPLPFKNWAASALVDARSGFPFSIVEENGLVAGGVNDQRFPFYFNLTLALERVLTLHGYRFALRGSASNITGQRNPTAVSNVIGSPEYLTFFGDEGRHFSIRIRFFGRRGATK